MKFLFASLRFVLTRPLGLASLPELQYARRLFSAKNGLKSAKLLRIARFMARPDSIKSIYLGISSSFFLLAIVILFVAMRIDFLPIAAFSVLFGILSLLTLFNWPFATRNAQDAFRNAMLFQLSRQMERDGFRQASEVFAKRLDIAQMKAILLASAQLYSDEEIAHLVALMKKRPAQAGDFSKLIPLFENQKPSTSPPPLNIPEVKGLILKFSQILWDRVLPNEQKDISITDGKLILLGRQIEAQLNCQDQLFQQPETVLCTKCIQRPNLKTYEFWAWMECPKCQSAEHLQAGIQAVVGWLGITEKQGLIDDRFYRPIWDNDRKTTKMVVMEELELEAFPDGNWALASALNLLENNPKLAKGLRAVRIPKALQIDLQNQNMMIKHHWKTEMI